MKLAYPFGDTPGQLAAWGKRLIDDLNRSQTLDSLPTFADDQAAGAGRLKVGEHYVTPAGDVRRRVA